MKSFNRRSRAFLIVIGFLTVVASAQIPALAGATSSPSNSTTSSQPAVAPGQVAADAGGNVMTAPPAPVSSAPASDSLTAMLCPNEFVREIRAVDSARRKIVFTEVRVTLAVCARSVEELRRTTHRWRKHTAFDEAYAQVRERELALRLSIDAAQSASPATAGPISAQVAADYEAYARAVATAEAAARGRDVASRSRAY